MLKKIGIVVLILIVGMLAYISTRPDTFHIERSAVVNASPETVFALINDFHQWEQWSPYEKRDLEMKKTFEGPAAGPGAIYAWSGNSEVGEGRMTLLDSKPGESVSIKLEFTRPFAATNQCLFTLAAAEGGTRVTWGMDGNNNFMSKAFSAFMDMDSMVGKDFEIGLANLNSAAQAQTQAPQTPPAAPLLAP